MLRQLACEAFAGLRQRCAAPAGEAFVRVRARAYSTGTTSSAWTFEQELSSQFSQDPRGAARAISRLPEVHKSRILEQIAHEDATLGSPKYLHSLFRDADKNNDGVLDPQELSIAIKKHQVATKDTRVDTPSREELLRVFTASTLPFVGFGFLDNLIMIMAGDYIDATLGAAFTLSTMAAAGLGNMVSDVAGIFCADVIEDKARIFKYGRYPNLSAVQKRLWPVVGLKTVGAILGIVVGCTLGMFPLFFVKHSEAGHGPVADAVHTPGA